jgi:hypothetical protein
MEDNTSCLEPGNVWTCGCCGTKLRITDAQGMLIYYVPYQLDITTKIQVYPRFVMCTEYKIEDNQEKQNES